MKTYVTNDGIEFTVRDCRELVRKLRASSPHPDTNMAAFMLSVAERTKVQMEAQVSTRSYEGFVADLLKCGLLREREDASG
jgi:hypothetical protein